MKIAKAYFKAWFHLAGVFSPLWLFSSLLLGFDNLFNLYLAYLVSIAALAGPLKLLFPQ